MSCPDSPTLLQSYVDGELTGDDKQSLEKHLGTCARCTDAVRLQSRFKAALKSQLAGPRLPSALQQRVSDALDRERSTRPMSVWFSFQRLVPAMGAMAVLVVVFFTARDRISPIIKQALRTHNTEIPLDIVTTNCEEAANWLRQRVGFNVQPPAVARLATCEGGRVVNVADGFGAYLRYRDQQGKRFGVLIVDNDGEAIEAPQRRMLGGKEVRLASDHGTSTAAFQGKGNVWYVVTSDDEASLQTAIEASFSPGHQ